MDQIIATILGVSALCILVGCGIGYYASESDHEHREQRVLDQVAITPNRTLDPKSLAVGIAYERIIHPPQ